MSDVEAPTVKITWVPGRNGSKMGIVSARVGDEPFTDGLDITKAKARDTIIETLCEKWPALARSEYRENL